MEVRRRGADPGGKPWSSVKSPPPRTTITPTRPGAWPRRWERRCGATGTSGRATRPSCTPLWCCWPAACSIAWCSWWTGAGGTAVVVAQAAPVRLLVRDHGAEPGLGAVVPAQAAPVGLATRRTPGGGQRRRGLVDHHAALAGGAFALQRGHRL